MQHIEAKSYDNGKIYLSVIKNGRLVNKVIEDGQFKPYLLIESNNPESSIKELVDGYPVEKLQLSSVSAYYETVNQMEDSGIAIYHKGITPDYQLLYKLNQQQSDDNPADNLFWFLDIETVTVKGKSGVELAHKGETEVLMIQIANSLNDNVYLLHWYQDYEPDMNDPRWENAIFMKFDSELEMLEGFLDLARKEKPLITTAHFGYVFDFPFLWNRYGVLKGLKHPAKKFSPFNRTVKRKIEIAREDVTINFPLGFPLLDFLDVYQKVTFGSRESWSLDFLSRYELGDDVGKVSYTDRGFLSIHEFVVGEYNPNLDEFEDSDLKKAYKRGASSAEMRKLWLDLFFEYGIEDVVLLKKMNKKLNALNLILGQAQIFSSNYDDIFGTVRPWMILLSNSALHERDRVLPNKSKYEEYTIAGGHVFAKPGLHKDVVIYDYTSLYPHNIMDLCMSPETYVDYEDLPPQLQQIQEKLLRHNEAKPYIFDGRIRCKSKEYPNGCHPDFEFEIKEWRDSCEDKMMKILDKFGDSIKEILQKHNLTMAPNGTFYRRDPNALLPGKVREIFNSRKADKNRIKEIYNRLDEPDIDRQEKERLENEILNLSVSEQTKKILINALYGFITSNYSPLANSNLGAAITSYGRFNIKVMTRHIVKFLNNGSYENLQDTDSFHLALKGVPLELTDELERTKWIYQYASRHISPEVARFSNEISSWFNGFGLLKMDFEAIAVKEIVVAKKRYVGKLWYDDKFLKFPKKKIVGIEIKRSSTPEAVKKAMDKTIDLIFEDQPQLVVNFIEKFRKILPYIDIRKTAIPTSISNLEKYYREGNDPILERFIRKGATQTAKASHLHNLIIENYEGFDIYDPIVSGDKIKIVPLKKQIIPEESSIDVIAFKDVGFLITAGIREKKVYEQGDKVDDAIHYQLLFEKTFLSPITNLLDSIGWESDKRKVKVKGVL